MSWPETRFEALYAEPSRNGVYKSKDHHGSGAKIVNMGELFAHEFVGPQEMSRLTMSEQELEKSGLRDGDLLFGRRSLVEAGAGKCSIVEGVDGPTTFESSIIRARLDPERCDPRFYYYWFRSPQGRGRIRSIVSGTNVKGIRGSDLKNLPVVQPDVSTQRRVVETIRPYDDLIETNRRRIALLEDAARLLYREWFVRFRFPSHEHVKITDSLPDGWEAMPLTACSTFQSGGTPSKAKPQFWDGEIPWVSSGEVTTFRISDAKWKVTEDAVVQGSRYAHPGTILAVVRGMSLAKEFRVGLVSSRVCFNQDIKAIVAKEGIEPLYLFHTLWEQRERIRQSAGEASHGTKKIETAVLGNVRIPIAPSSLRRQFVEYVSGLHAQWDALFQQNQKLAQARDLLLPRLVNGEIAV